LQASKTRLSYEPQKKKNKKNNTVNEKNNFRELSEDQGYVLTEMYENRNAKRIFLPYLKFIAYGTV
jgi:hypothetical protein